MPQRKKIRRVRPERYPEMLTGIRMSATMYAALGSHADVRGQTLAEVVRAALATHLGCADHDTLTHSACEA